MAGKTWRDSAKPIIAEVIKQHKGEDIKVVKKALREAYPFGERKYHPYKIWTDEIRVQLGTKKKKVRGQTDDPQQLNLL